MFRNAGFRNQESNSQRGRLQISKYVTGLCLSMKQWFYRIVKYASKTQCQHHMKKDEPFIAKRNAQHNTRHKIQT